VQVYPAGQLGNDPKAIEQLALGGVDFTVSSTGSYAPHVDSLNMTMLPYLVESYEQGWKLYDESKWLQTQFDKAPAKGFRFLATWEAGFRCMTFIHSLSCLRLYRRGFHAPAVDGWYRPGPDIRRGAHGGMHMVRPENRLRCRWAALHP